MARGEFHRIQRRPTLRLCRSVTCVPLCREKTNRRSRILDSQRVSGTCDDWSFMSAANAESEFQLEEAPRILLLEDSPGEAELFCQALVNAWQRYAPKTVADSPTIEIRHTARGALEILKSHIERKPSSLPHLISLCWILTFLQETVWPSCEHCNRTFDSQKCRSSSWSGLMMNRLRDPFARLGSRAMLSSRCYSKI